MTASHFLVSRAPEPQPGVSSAGGMPGRGNLASAHGSMNHLAFDVPLDKFEEYRQRLIDEGVDVSDILDHDDSELTVAAVSILACLCGRSTFSIQMAFFSNLLHGLARWAPKQMWRPTRSPSMERKFQSDSLGFSQGRTRNTKLTESSHEGRSAFCKRRHPHL